MKIVVTGASGFLGNALLPLLKAAGHDIIAAERKTGVDVGNWEQVRSLPASDLVIHMAARSYVPEAYENPRPFYDTNVGGTLNMLEYARLHGARFVFISSYVYGHPQYQPIDEAHPVAAVNPYGQSKLMGEELAAAYSWDFGLDVTILRPFNIYGKGQPEHFLLPKILKQAAAGSVIELFDPRPKRDYVEVRDMATAILASVENGGSGCRIYNIGSGRSYSIEDVIGIIRPFYRHELEVRFLNKFRPDEILDTVCDNRRAASGLGWTPSITLEAGLRDMAAELI